MRTTHGKLSSMEEEKTALPLPSSSLYPLDFCLNWKIVSIVVKIKVEVEKMDDRQ